MTDTDERTSGPASPLPWKLCAHLAGTDPDCPCGYTGGVWDATEETIVAMMGAHRGCDGILCDCAHTVKDEPSRQRNAQYMAEACNAYPSLVAFLRDYMLVLRSVSACGVCKLCQETAQDLLAAYAAFLEKGQ